jgi:long-chain acyl-CoA synthetase
MARSPEPFRAGEKPVNERPWLKSYPEGVPASLAPYPDRSLHSLLEDAAARHPNGVATVFFGKKTTYAELVKQVDQFSRALVSLGVKKGDRVVVVLPNCPQYVIAVYAAARIGAVFVGTNPLYTEREMVHQLNDCGAEVCVVLDTLYHAVGPVRDQTPLTKVVVTKLTGAMPFPLSRLAPIELKREAKKHGEPWPPVAKDADVVWWESLMLADLPEAPAAEIDPVTDLASLVYTGGTTGLAKGAMLTHGNLLWNTIQSAAWFPGLRDGAESVMCVLPFFHSYGLTVCMNLGILKAGKLILMPRFDLKRALKAVQKEKATLFPGVPRLYVSINESPETKKYDLRSITACLSGAAPLPAVVAEKFERITGGNLVEGYGLTETSPVTHANPVLGRRRAGTIGLPITDTDCRVVELGDWTQEVAPGEPGQLLIAGPQVMRGYWNRPEETELMLKHDADGRVWLLTGDVAVMDEDGYFSIVDRMKDMIIVSGFNVYPTEVEAILQRHPKVLQVSVIGVPDERTGEAVKAFVVLREGETAGVTVTQQELVDFAGDPEHGLSRYRVPKQIEFRNSLPETMIGKVLRRVLVAEEREKAGAGARDPAV